MAIIDFRLLAETQNGEWSYSVTVEEVVKGLVRLNVSRTHESSNEPEISQGVDLTGEECEALGKHFVAIAERLHKYGP